MTEGMTNKQKEEFMRAMDKSIREHWKYVSKQPKCDEHNTFLSINSDGTTDCYLCRHGVIKRDPWECVNK